jgi:hypothetical protein
MSRKYISILFLVMSTLAHSPRAAAGPGPADQCRFIGIRKFSGFTTASSTNADETVLLSPVIKAPEAEGSGPVQHGAMLLARDNRAPMAWNELVVSWNADAPPESWLKVEARAIFPDHETKFYTMGIWSKDSAQHPRSCVRRQKDSDGTVNEDTLVLNRPGADVQLRLTLAGPGGTLLPRLKFLGLSFLDNSARPAPLRPRRAAWGKIIPTTERSQHSYPQANGWCSPTSLSMVLTRWGEVLHRPELTGDVPEVAAGVYDDGFGGTGNWPFNTAYAGSFPGMRAYVARFSDISELEDWIAAGIPVIISARWDLLAPGRPLDLAGHLTVCIGFTKNGDLVINDPATNFKKGQKVRHIYTRENIIKAWQTSHNTVYLVYPEKARIPADRFGHWDKP